MKQKKQLRSLGHKLHPVVLLGNAGLTEAVQASIDEALGAHELIKVKVPATDRTERNEIIGMILDASKAELVQQIGHIALLYRRHPEKPIIQI